MKTSEMIKILDQEWEKPGGFFGELRDGNLSLDQAHAFIEKLERIRGHLADESNINRRLVSLLWYAPMFMEWQKDRIGERGGDIKSYSQLVARITNIIEDILGVP